MVDRFPNYINAELTQSGVDTFTVLDIPTPRNLLAGEPTVKEFLWIEYFVPNPLLDVIGDSVILQLTQGAKDIVAPLNPSDTRLISQFLMTTLGTTVTGGNGIIMMPQRINLQSADGFGFLFAGEVLHFSIDSSNTALATFAGLRIAYRDVRVTTLELNGLIISLLSG